VHSDTPCETDNSAEHGRNRPKNDCPCGEEEKPSPAVDEPVAVFAMSKTHMMFPQRMRPAAPKEKPYPANRIVGLLWREARTSPTAMSTGPQFQRAKPNPTARDASAPPPDVTWSWTRAAKAPTKASPAATQKVGPLGLRPGIMGLIAKESTVAERARRCRPRLRERRVAGKDATRFAPSQRPPTVGVPTLLQSRASSSRRARRQGPKWAGTKANPRPIRQVL